MKKISYTNLKLKTNNEVKTCNFNESIIEVLQYLAIQDKYDLVMIALQKSLEDGIYNPLKLDMYFHLNIVYLYTNLNFTDKQRDSENLIYDNLLSSGLLDMILDNIPDEEYNTLCDYLEETKNSIITYKNTVVSLMQSLIDDLPKNAEAAMDIVNNFDKEQFKEVIDFAKSVNNGKIKN